MALLETVRTDSQAVAACWSAVAGQELGRRLTGA